MTLGRWQILWAQAAPSLEQDMIMKTIRTREEQGRLSLEDPETYAGIEDVNLLLDGA